MVSMELIKKLREITQAGVMDAKKALEENNSDMDAAIQWLREKGIAKAAKKSSSVATEGVAKVLIKDNTALIFELNSQTDFVASNEAFLALANDISLALISAGTKNIDEIISTTVLSSGKTIEVACNELTAKIGEKISLRRYEIITKTDEQMFSSYEHSNGKIAVLLIVDQQIDPLVGKDIAMHAAAMAPKFLNQSNVDQAWLENEIKILKEQTIAEGKPIERVDQIVKGRVNKLLSEVTLEAQQFVKDTSVSIKQHLARSNNANLLRYIRFEVGEGVEKQVVDFAAEVAAQIKK